MRRNDWRAPAGFRVLRAAHALRLDMTGSLDVGRSHREQGCWRSHHRRRQLVDGC